MNMGKAKHLNPRAKIKKSVVLILSLIVALALAVGATVAYLQATTNSVINTFTPAEVKIEINESKDETTKSNISFTNSGNVPVYIRATLVINWTDTFDMTDDNVDNPTEQIIPKPALAEINGGTVLGTDWFNVGDIYYYSKPVAPGASTSVMLNPITVTLPDGSTAKCKIDVRAEAIQAEPTSAVEDAWDDVDVVSGELIAKGTN